MEKDHCDNSRSYPHCPELDIITSRKQSIIGRWALPIMLAMATIAIAVFAYVYLRISSYC